MKTFWRTAHRLRAWIALLWLPLNVKIAFGYEKVTVYSDFCDFGNGCINQEYNNRPFGRRYYMNMSRVGSALFGALFFLMLNVANAEIKLNDSSEIVGSWLLESVAPGITKPKIPENRTWDFKPDGSLTVTGFNRHFQRDDKQKFSYQVVDGILKIGLSGGGSRPTEYRVYEKNDSTMILQGGLEGFYFFKKN